MNTETNQTLEIVKPTLKERLNSLREHPAMGFAEGLVKGYAAAVVVTLAIVGAATVVGAYQNQEAEDEEDSTTTEEDAMVAEFIASLD